MDCSTAQVVSSHGKTHWVAGENPPIFWPKTSIIDLNLAKYAKHTVIYCEKNWNIYTYLGLCCKLDPQSSSILMGSSLTKSIQIWGTRMTIWKAPFKHPCRSVDLPSYLDRSIVSASNGFRTTQWVRLRGPGAWLRRLENVHENH